MIGELVPSTSILMESPSRPLKERLRTELVVETLKDGGSALVVLSNKSPSKYLSELEKNGVDLNKQMNDKNLVIIDWYSWNTERVIGIKKEGSIIRSSSDILNLSISVDKGIKDLSDRSSKIAVLDFLDKGRNIFGWDTVFDYSCKMVNKLKEDDFTVFNYVEKELEADERNNLYINSDGVMKITFSEGYYEFEFKTLGLDYEDKEKVLVSIVKDEIVIHEDISDDLDLRDTFVTLKEEEGVIGKSNSFGLESKKINDAGKTNGRINGLGKVNGKINGVGKTNGRINGLGKVNGKINGVGKTNGIDEEIFTFERESKWSWTEGRSDTASLPAEDGLINGIGGISGPSIDFTSHGDEISLPAEDGLVNGIAGIPGFSSLREDDVKDTMILEEPYLEGRIPRKGMRNVEWFKKGLGTVMILLFLLFIPVLFNILYIAIEEPIDIDGDFEDWRGIRAYHEPPITIFDRPSLHVQEYKLHVSGGYLYLYSEMNGTLFETNDDVYSFRVFVDVIEDEGYDLGTMRADYQAEIYGWDGELQGTNFYSFNTSRSSDDWNGFERSGSVRVEHDEKRLETRMWLSEVHEGADPSVVIHTSCGDLSYTTGGAVVPEKDAVLIDIHPSQTRFLGSGEENKLLTIEALSLSGVVELNSLTIEYNDLSEPYIESIKIYRDDLLIGSDEDFVNTTEITIEEEIDEEPTYFEVWGKVSSNAPEFSVTGLDVTDADTEDGMVTIKPNNVDNFYIEGVPEKPRVTGAFSDWIDQDLFDDPFDDLSPHDAWNPNIDIRRYSLTEGDINDAAFMVSVEGNMMGGADVPYIRGRPPELIDSDGDGIPDIYDPFPYDFTNDGTPDSEMVTEDGLPDVDGDGVADYPYGPDKWLNTTIPPHPQIPREYWGRKVSRYIGPVDIPTRTGEESTHIFIDADDDPSTGYTAPYLGNLGAEYVITVTGRNMEVYSSNVSRYVGNGNSWEWEHVDEVDVALNRTSLETAINFEDLEIDPDFKVTYVTTDWNDVMDSVTPLSWTDPSLRSAQEGFEPAHMDSDEISIGNLSNIHGTRSTGDRSEDQILYLREDDSLLPTMGDEEESIELRNKDDEDIQEFVSGSFRDDFNISSYVSVRLYLSPSGSGPHNPGLETTILNDDEVVGQNSLAPINYEGWYSIDIDIDSFTFEAGEALTLRTRIIGEDGNLLMGVHYNSEERDSRLSIPTNTVISIDELDTYDEEGEQSKEFEEGDIVESRALISHPLGSQYISDAYMTVYDPEGEPLWEDVEMEVVDEEEGYLIFSSTFTLPDDPLTGLYEIEVNTHDVQGIEDIDHTEFLIPSEVGVVIYPDNYETVEPGETAEYSLFIWNIGEIADNYEIDTGSSSRGWPTDLYIGGEHVAEDEDGDGTWDWVHEEWDTTGSGMPDIQVPSGYEEEIVVRKSTPDEEGRTDSTTIYALSADHDEVSDDATLVTRIPKPEVMKTLYLHDGDYMDTEQHDNPTSMTIEDGEENIFVQEPSLYSDLSLQGEAKVYLYIIPEPRGQHQPVVSATLMDSGEVIGSEGIGPLDEEGWYDFTINTDHTLSSGDSLELEIASSSEAIEINFDCYEYDSRIEFYTDTYINVDEVITYNETEATRYFSAGEEVVVRSKVSNPFGPQHVDDVIMSIFDPDGELLIEQEMDLVENMLTENDHLTYEGSYELDTEAEVGEYRTEVFASDDDYVTSDEDTSFQIPSGVDVSPDHESEAQAGDTVYYDHTITNTGRGNDIFELSVGSSLGYNITLYGPDGSVMGIDYGGDGNWEYVDPDWDSTGSGSPDTGKLKMDESFDVTLAVEIPGDAEGEFQDVTTLTATSDRNPDVSDSATDITNISEFEDTILPVIFVIAIFIGMFGYRRKKENGEKIEEEDVEPSVDKEDRSAKTKNISVSYFIKKIIGGQST